jgi:hypothetical protein
LAVSLSGFLIKETRQATLSAFCWILFIRGVAKIAVEAIDLSPDVQDAIR